MSKVIIGIHGLANKPPKDALTDYWKRAIAEGLAKTCGVAAPEVEFDLVYWADRLYQTPLHEDRDYDFDDLYNTEPYTEGAAKLTEYRDGWLDEARRIGSTVVGGATDFVKHTFGVERLADWVLARKLKDLAFYYDPDRRIPDRSDPPKKVQARQVLQGELRTALEAHKGKRIMLIAHSMGTIIAYDELRDYGRKHNDFEVEHFVTIGSPLGLPHVLGKIVEEREYSGAPDKRVRTPTVVAGSWKNFADRRDPVALDSHLGDDYGPNARGCRVEDDLVDNGYRGLTGEPNYHKSYGYLRAPELSRHINAFLQS